MNTRASLKRIEALVDESGILTGLLEGLEREPQGLKTNAHAVRLLLIGLLLSISECKSATITGAHTALTTYIDVRDQMRLGVRTGPDPRDVIPRDRLYYAANLLTSRLAYGESVATEIGEAEVVRRRTALVGATNALLDYTASATDLDDSRLAIDATAVWSWGRGKYCPKPTAAEIAAQEDELVREQLLRLAKGHIDENDLEGVTVTDDPELLEGYDRDAAWSGSTAKNGGLKRFFGYFANVICAVPGARRQDDEEAIAPIVRRVELTRATKDVVDVTLRMIDSLPQAPREVLVDRHYSYKQFPRWFAQLLMRGIRQVLDLRSDDHGVIYLPEGIFADGFGHCGAMPREHLGQHRPGVFAPWSEHVAFQEAMERRERYAYGVINPMDEERRTKLQCPARQFKVACPLYPPSMMVAAEQGLPIVNPDLLELEPDDALPRSCTQDSFRITLPEPIAKLNQSAYWGTVKWYGKFGGRTYVEGVFGNLKNPRTENLKRGTIQKTGIVWVQLVMSLVCATYNLRIIRERHERLGRPWEGHPLLSPDADTVTHVSLSRDNESRLFADFATGVPLDDLEVHSRRHSDTRTCCEERTRTPQGPTSSPLAYWVSVDARTSASL